MTQSETTFEHGSKQYIVKKKCHSNVKRKLQKEYLRSAEHVDDIKTKTTRLSHLVPVEARRVGAPLL